MLRILQIGMSDNLGGIEMFLINFYRKLNKEKFQFDFINMYDNDLCFQNEIISSGGRVYKTSNEKKHPFKFRNELKEIIENNNYDIVHVHKNSLAFIGTLKMLKKCNVKVKIIHSHNTQSSRPNFLINILHNINKRRIKKYCDYFYACSEEAGYWMYPKDIVKSARFTIIHNAIDLNKFKFNPVIRKRIRQELGISDDTKVIGHIGRFTPQKNHKFLIDFYEEVYKKNKNSVLILIGTGPLYEEIKQKVKLLNLEKNVLLLGKKENVHDYYQAFDAFVLPSIYEGLGIVLIEAQASGLPCLTSDRVPSISKITDNIQYISLDSTISEWINQYNAVIGLSHDRNDECQKIIASGFNIDKEIVKLEDCYLRFIK